MVSYTSAGARFQPVEGGTGSYRYRLWREWWSTEHRVVWVMLNPSTANEKTDDPTIRRCVSFARRWGYGAIDVVNLFAVVSSEPSVLRTHPDPVGSENDLELAEMATRPETKRVVVAWGAFPEARERAAVVVRALKDLGISLHCLGTTRSGAPRHPLYIPSGTELVPYVMPQEASGP